MVLSGYLKSGNKLVGGKAQWFQTPAEQRCAQGVRNSSQGLEGDGATGRSRAHLVPQRQQLHLCNCLWGWPEDWHNWVSTANCTEKATLQRVGGAEMQSGTKALAQLPTNGRDIVSTEEQGDQRTHRAPSGPAPERGISICLAFKISKV